MSGDALRDRVMESINVILPRVIAPDAEEPPGFTESTRPMEDLGMTSTSTLELILELEDALETTIDVEDIEPDDLASIGALADFIARHVMVPD